MYIAEGVSHPEPQYVEGVATCWNVYPRAVVSNLLDLNTGLYCTICDFKRDELKVQTNNQIHEDPLGGTRFWLRQGEMIAVGLGIRLDFDKKFWYHGLISMRKVGLFRGLEVVNANNPIYADDTQDKKQKKEIVAFVKNNGDAQYLGRHEALLQIHFSESLRCPNLLIEDTF